MKKSLIAFYLKVALAIGVPVLGVAAIIAVINNDPKVNEDEIHIIETTQSSFDESEGGEIVVPQPTADEPTVNAPTVNVPTNTPTTNPVTTNPVITHPVTTSQATTEPEPTTTKFEPTQPTTTQPTTGEEPVNNYDVKYTYDLLGRLIKAEYEQYILEYIYDSNGNILKINKILK